MVTGHDSHEPSAKAFNESMKEKVDFKAKISIICISFDLISTFLCQLLLHATASNLDRTHRIFPPCRSSGRSIPQSDDAKQGWQKTINWCYMLFDTRYRTE